MKIKKSNIVILASITLLLSAIVGYKAYSTTINKQKNLEILTNIETIKGNFNNETSRNKKLEILENMELEYSEFSSKDIKDVKNLDSNYTTLIDDMKQFFIEDYNKTIKDNTLENLDKIDDKELLNKNKKALVALIEIIEIEKDIVSKDFSTDEIKQLINLYEAKIASIDKAIEEAKIAEAKAKAAAEEEARVQAEEKAKAIEKENKVVKSKNTTNNKTTASNNTSNIEKNQNNNNNKNNNKNTSTLPFDNYNKIYAEHRWALDSNGNKIEGSDIWGWPDGMMQGLDGVFFHA